MTMKDIISKHTEEETVKLNEREDKTKIEMPTYKYGDNYLQFIKKLHNWQKIKKL